jgi:hypothetical protein
LLSVFVDRAWSNMLEELLIYTALALDSRWKSKKKGLGQNGQELGYVN